MRHIIRDYLLTVPVPIDVTCPFISVALEGGQPRDCDFGGVYWERPIVSGQSICLWLTDSNCTIARVYASYAVGVHVTRSHADVSIHAWALR